MVTLVIVAVTAGLIWNLVFDLWLGQVERQYLWENERHQQHIGPAVSLKAMMDAGTSAGFWVASGWSLLVALAILVAAWYAYRQGKGGSQ